MLGLVWQLYSGASDRSARCCFGLGDSGGAALRQTANGWEFVGINTFTEGYGGRFGDTGGGVLVAPYTVWIYQTTGIPESSCMGMLTVSMILAIGHRSRVLRHGGNQPAHPRGQRSGNPLIRR